MILLTILYIYYKILILKAYILHTMMLEPVNWVETIALAGYRNVETFLTI